MLQLFRRYGVLILLFAHLIPGLRSGIAIPAGVSQMPRIAFGGLIALGAALRATLQTVAGLFLAPPRGASISTLSLPGAIIVGGLAVVALGWAGARRKRGHPPSYP
ncbi:DedA family protein [Thermoflexus sp.]|uniref:DedA family protein n=1 Tax=Thermoflexus sp. TaxID=1969742 RepID=UPI0035E424A6